ncbi:MAG: hypothetical protein QXS85_06150 [Acidilobaceae archaeon]
MALWELYERWAGRLGLGIGAARCIRRLVAERSGGPTTYKE